MSATPNLLHSSRVHERHAELLKLDAEHLRLRILALETGMDEGEIKAILATPSADKSTSVGADFKEEVTSEGCEESPGKVGSKRQRTSGQGTETTPASENKSTETSSQQTGSVPKPPKYSSKSVAADSSTASSAVKVEKARPAGVSKKDSAMGVDWTKVRRRRIALKIAYVGDRYAGFAAQVSHPTVEVSSTMCEIVVVYTACSLTVRLHSSPSSSLSSALSLLLLSLPSSAVDSRSSLRLSQRWL